MTEEQEKKNANSIGLLPRPPVADTTLLTCVLGYICTGGALHWCDHAMQPWSMNTRQWYEQERLRKETHVSVDSGIFRANSDSPHGIDLTLGCHGTHCLPHCQCQ